MLVTHREGLVLPSGLSRVASRKGNSLSRSYSRMFTDIEGLMCSAFPTSSRMLGKSPGVASAKPLNKGRRQQACIDGWNLSPCEGCLSPGPTAHPDIPEEAVAAFPVPGGTCESLTRWAVGKALEGGTSGTGRTEELLSPLRICISWPALFCVNLNLLLHFLPVNFMRFYISSFTLSSQCPQDEAGMGAAVLVSLP